MKQNSLKLIYNTKIKKIIGFISSLISNKAAQGYYTDKFLREVDLCHSSVIVKGRYYISDPRNIVVGKNVVIGKNCRFYSDGGIYLEDGVKIKNNIEFYTYDANRVVKNLSAYHLYSVKSIIVPQNTKVEQSIDYKFVFSNQSSKECNTANLDFIIVSTGRSGTNAIANFLNKRSEIKCGHESFFVLNRLSTEFAHNFKSKDEVMTELKSLFLYTSLRDNDSFLFGDCDQKYANLIPILKEIIPNLKVIWLIRHAKDFVTSTFGRRWFDEYEYTHPNPVFSFDVTVETNLFSHYRMEYAKYRLNGYLAKEFDKDSWMKMSCFERCCWYWFYWNTMIDEQVECLSKEDLFFIRLEDLEQNQNFIYSFLNIPNKNISLEQTNKAYYQKIDSDNWDENQKISFKKWCTPGLKKWYPIDE